MAKLQGYSRYPKRVAGANNVAKVSTTAANADVDEIVLGFHLLYMNQVVVAPKKINTMTTHTW